MSKKEGKLRIKKHSSIADFQKVVAKGESVTWDKAECSDMPEFNIKFPFEEFSSASFEITFWSIDSLLKSDLPNEVNSAEKIVASCYFSFNKVVQAKA